MPSFSQWLTGSWEDFRRRWGVLLAVAGLGGAATLVGGLVPFLPAAILATFQVGAPWLVWGAASVAAILAALWLSTWTQAAMTRAALVEETAGASLKWGWERTPAFAWVLSLTLLAVAGGWFLLVIPGLLLSVLFFCAPFYFADGEAEGLAALELSWARVKPRFGAVALRMLAGGLLTAAPGWIPYVGWIVMMFWAPFGIVSFARLARDLRAADPSPARPRSLAPAVAGLSAVFCAGTLLSAALLVVGARAAMRRLGDPAALADRVNPAALQALTAAYSGDSTDEQKRKALMDVFEQLASTAPAAAPVVSTATVLGAP